MRKKTLLAVSVLMIILVPVVLSAQKMHMEKMHKEMGCMHGGKGLNLDPDQKLAIEKLKLEHKLANIDIKAEQMKLKEQIKEELLKDEPSRKTIEGYMKKIAANREKMQKSHLDHALEAKKVLSPEQWKMFVTHHWDGMGRMDHGMGGGCRCGMCAPKGMGMKGGCGMKGHAEGKGMGEGCPMKMGDAE
jgi:Spy/CpxP family protein refolding chaperone